jgi:organic radical activating enzyme
LKKRVNDIFYSLQGEGHNTGRAAVFIRFAGCNLRCPFCDTEFDSYREMSDEEILTVVSDFRLQTTDCRPQTTDYRLLVVLTGGEPTLQVDAAFVDLLHEHGYEVAMESNGTRPAPRNLDWLTVSPKVLGGETFSGERSEVRGERLPDELKVIFDEHTDPEAYLPSPTTHHPSPITHHPSPIKHLYLQPCDTGDAQRNADITARCIDYIKHHPWWRLSLQTHKLIGFK